MHPTATAPPVNPLSLIPPPGELRLIIAQRHAELTVLRRLLKAAESKTRLCPDGRQDASKPEVAHAS